MKKLMRFFVTIMLIISVALCFCGCMKEVLPPPTGDDVVTDDNTGDNTGDKPGDNTGDKPGDNTGDKPGDNTGDKPGDKPGDNTGDKPGDNTGDKPGDNTGDKPGDNTGDKPGDNTGRTPTHATPQSAKTTVYYTNSEGWGSVYAYVWNYSTGSKMAEWPGKKLTKFGTSGYGEDQYRIEVDCSVYDRVIFNDGNGKQTKDLVVGGATSGYYGESGIFTMGTDDYGKVECFDLKDTKNLSYISGATKKITVYTPSSYTTSKKYGVLYMFDSQSLYLAADGAAKSHYSLTEKREYWCADVAVTNLVKNGGDGLIIVAVDNTDGHRDSELTMSQSFGTLTDLANEPEFYNGKLDELGNFMRETLMPWVSEHYSVDTSREKTGIAGSSSGGLAAYYLGLRDNDLYSYIGAFSPANGLFTSSDWTRFYSGKDFSAGRPKVYVYCGKSDNDLEDMLLPAAKQIKNLTSYGFKASDIIENYVEKATHNEIYWRVAFTDFLSKMAK